LEGKFEEKDHLEDLRVDMRIILLHDPSLGKKRMRARLSFWIVSTSSLPPAGRLLDCLRTAQPALQNEMGRKCSTHGKYEKAYILSENLQEMSPITLITV
jgi:hypothetical protein